MAKVHDRRGARRLNRFRRADLGRLCALARWKDRRRDLRWQRRSGVVRV